MCNKDEFEDTKGVIRIGKSKKNRQHNGQKKTDKQRSTKDAHNVQLLVYAFSYVVLFGLSFMKFHLWGLSGNSDCTAVGVLGMTTLFAIKKQKTKN